MAGIFISALALVGSAASVAVHAQAKQPLPFASVAMNKHVLLAPASSRVVENHFGSSGNGSSIPANGSVWPTAIYWSMVQIGTPARNFPVAIDSGSGDLDISGKGCKGCVLTPPNNQYDSTSSSTAKAEFPYTFSNSYQTCDLTDPVAVCTITGKLYTDQVSLAGLGPVKVSLGSIETQTSNFDQFKQIDGVMGFTQGGPKNVFAQLVANNKCENVWAMCMAEGSTSNGTLTIGGVDPRLSDGAVAYVPDDGMGFHAVEVQSITVHDVNTTTSPMAQSARTVIPVSKSAILDTGTNILLVPKSVLTEIHTAMCNKNMVHCEELWSDKCVALTPTQLQLYPLVTLQLANDVTLDLHSWDYLLQGSPLATAPDQYCLGIRDGGSAGGGFIIGDTIMRNYYLVFDLAEKKIGWGPVSKQCGSI